MCLSVRVGEKPRLEHYLIETTPKGLKLEGSTHHFSSIPVLIAHYCENFDELPIRLVLPPAIQQAQTHQELTSLALLGPDFWMSSVSEMKPVVKPTSKPAVSPYQCGQSGIANTPTTMSFSSDGAFTAVQSSSQLSEDPSMPFQQTFSTTSLIETSSSQFQHSSKAQSGLSDAMSSPQLSSSGFTNAKASHTSTFTTHIHQHTQPNHQHSTSLKPEIKPRTRYYRSHLNEKLSDYEDIWNLSSPLSGMRHGEVFIPILNGTSKQNLMEKTQSSPPFSAVNAGYISDSNSDRGSTLPKQDFSSQARECDHSEETKTVQKSQIRIDLNSEANVFTFEIGPPQGQPKPIPTTRPPPLPMWGTPIVTKSSVTCPQPVRHSSHSSPSYAEPYDSRIGKVNGVTGTQGAIKVSNSLRCIAEEKNDLPIPPIAEDYSTPLIDFSEPRTQKEEFHAIMKQAESLEPILSPRILSQSARSGSQSSLIYDLPSVSPTHKKRWSMCPTTIQNNEVLSNIQRSQSMKVLPIRRNSKTMSAQTHSRSPSKSPSQSSPLPKQMETLNLAGKSTPNFSQASTPEVRPPPETKLPKLVESRHVSGASSVSEANSRGPTISQSFEDNFFKPELIRKLENLQVCTLRKFPVHHSHRSLHSDCTSFSENTTVEDIISDVSPELTVKPIKPLTVNNVSRMSEYDNMNGISMPSSRRTMASSVGTNYCQPWDSSMWEELLKAGLKPSSAVYDTPAPPAADSSVPGSFPLEDQWLEENGMADDDGGSSEADYSSIYLESRAQHGSRTNLLHSELPKSFEWQNTVDKDSAAETTPQPPVGEAVPPDEESVINKDSHVPLHTDISDDEGMEDDHKLELGPENFRDRIMPFISTPRLISLRNRSNKTPGSKLTDFVFRLAQDKSTTFGVTVENFIRCTKEGTEANPHIVMRNVRQFMNGIKNYLIQTGEAELNAIIAQEREKLNEKEFLNIDAILEGALHKCVIKPLKQHIYQLFVEEYRKNGSLQQLSDNIKYARTKSLPELGIKPEFIPPQGTSMEVIKHFLNKMQKVYSPLKKLENLLGATSSIYNSVQNTKDIVSGENGVCMGADDFLPMFMYVLSHSGMVSAEIEADYMWGLLHPCLLAGEGGYYLTTLSSAVHVLKNLKAADEIPDSPSGKKPPPAMSDLQGFMKIIMPDEKNDSIITKTLPVRPNMTTKVVCMMIAHKFKITNPQDYGLYVLVAGVEEQLADNQCPQNVKDNIREDGLECVFAYKRVNARFVWPISFKN